MTNDLLQTALQHHQAGRLADAEALYRQILTQNPNHPDALHLLGILAYQHRRYDSALDLFHRALASKPEFPEALSNLGNVLKDLHRLDEATAAYQQALALKPDFPDALNNLGNVQKDLHHLDAAIASYQKALALQPDFPDALSNLAAAYKDQGQFADAIAACRRALTLDANHADALNNLGAVLLDTAQYEEAITTCRRAIDLNPTYLAAQKNLGLACFLAGRTDEAIDHLNRALQLLTPPLLTPSSPTDDPVRADIRNALASALRDQARLDESLTASQQAITLQPSNAHYHSNHIYTLLFHPNYSAKAIYQEHARWNQQHAASLAREIRPHSNDRSPNRRLRIGYVSPDFRAQVVGFNLQPLFDHRSTADFEIVAYSDVAAPDAATAYFQSKSDSWRNIVRLTDQELAELIRQDQIDILVDLLLHASRSRLLAFARKPAPIQLTFVGYPGTTGLTTMDYRLTDPYLDPPTPAPGLFDAYYSEKSIRLPHTFWCYDPRSTVPAVNTLPALSNIQNGGVTLGCLNNFCKVTDQALHLWARVLNAIPRSRLMILANPGSHRKHVLDIFSQNAITADRIQFLPRATRPEYLKYYHAIDLCLDTFPYNGHSTSLDSFWMGVPVITLVGKTVVGRAGLSQLTNLGLTELIAHTPDQFVQIATDLARDLPRLAQLRATLRPRMQQSPLMNAPDFAQAIESAYRQMWHHYCSSPPPPSPGTGTPDGNPGHSQPP